MAMMNFTVTESAVKRIRFLRERENRPRAYLRISVQGGGCAGFEQKMDFDDQVNDDDHIFGETVIIDDMSLAMLSDGQLDFKKDLIGESFSVDIPNAKSSCGCGTSFSL